jgi:trehalose 6-phosphate synthase/phosphatase
VSTGGKSSSGDPPETAADEDARGGSDERRLLVASNRLPFTIERQPEGLRARPSPGGLVSALQPVLGTRGGTWVGWPGLAVGESEEIPFEEDSYRILPVRLSEFEIAHYLDGFANRTLWPMFHSFPAHARLEQQDFHVYERVNQRFADAIQAETRSEDLVWIHDYQLMLTPDLIRTRTPNARLSFFLHIPFPPYDIFRLLPWDRELLRGVLACDLVGFHVRGYAQNFLDCAERRLGARVDRDAMVVEYGDRAIQVGAFPIGIDYRAFEERALGAPALPETQRERVVLGADRLDYTKGIAERIHAFARLFELHPEHRERVVLLQLAVPSRSRVAEYQDLRREIDEAVGHVNGRFATASWSPIRYLYRSFSHQQLAAIYRDADVALVTPVRDGMNLVAKEYVASQVEDPGVLVLSRLAGAAETMREALLVNPYNVDESAEAIHRALTMEEPERRSRMAALRKRESRNDVHTWVQSFLSEAASSRVSLSPIGDQDFRSWLGAYLKRPRLALFLDYDGTLTPLCNHPADAVLSDDMRAALGSCIDRQDTDVAIVSGRALFDIQRMLDCSGLTYAGNHGLEIAGSGIPDFRHEDLVHYQARIEELVKQLEEVAVEGAWTEAKGPTLTYHFRGVAPEHQARLAERARAVITAAGFQARDAQLAIEGRPPIGWDKGRAVLHILRTRYGPSWSDEVRVIYAGDDQTDEDAFRFLAGLAMTFRVGSADALTSATRRLPNVDAVRALLEWLGQR